MLNFKFFHGAGDCSAAASKGTVLMMEMRHGAFTGKGICIAVDPKDQSEYNYSHLETDLSVNPDRWVEMSRSELWGYCDLIGAAILYNAASIRV